MLNSNFINKVEIMKISPLCKNSIISKSANQIQCKLCLCYGPMTSYHVNLAGLGENSSWVTVIETYCSRKRSQFCYSGPKIPQGVKIKVCILTTK